MSTVAATPSVPSSNAPPETGGSAAAAATETVLDYIKKGRPNKDICRLVRDNIAKDICTVVNVQSCVYNYLGLGERQSRAITLEPNGNVLERFVDKIRALFLGFPDTPTFLGNQLANYILGIETDKGKNQEAENELRVALRQRRIIIIYVSEDASRIYCYVQGGRGPCKLL